MRAGVPYCQVSVDTEGEDALVIHGMANALREKRVDVFEFEPGPHTPHSTDTRITALGLHPTPRPLTACRVHCL